MALKICEDCKKEISTMAVSCPNCGRPNANLGVVTIEQTQKKWKQLDLLSLLLFVPGCLYISFYTGFLGPTSKQEPGFVLIFFIAIAMSIVGVLVGIGSGIGRWYHHK